MTHQEKPAYPQTSEEILDRRIAMENEVGTLKLYIRSKEFLGLDKRTQENLKEQLRHMEDFSWVLLRRLKQEGV